ncbi:hypothetical protein NBRC116188_15950 [Oceaniserpentilla sp. 4NH20-0058]|uniref:methyltransferase domain-containing protein n=1 Tax=Oceaniserpentilla sp. 4NH20-0058 TaxID=3127660 RepID=UPI00310B7616
MALSNQTSDKPLQKISKHALKQLSELKKQAFVLFNDSVSSHEDPVRSESLQQARSIIKQALELYSAETECLNLLTRIELESGQFELAQAYIKQALVLEPENAGYWYSAGHVALALHDLEYAEKAFRKAIELAPKQTRADVSLAYTIAEQGRQIEAFQLYRQLVKTQTQDIQVKSRLLESAKGLVADYYDKELEQDLITYLSWDDVNLDNLSHLCCSVLIFKFQLNHQGSAASFNDMASCTLLLDTLRKTIIKNELLEKLIIAIRQELLTHASKKGRLINQYIPLCEAICQYQIKNEFLLPYSEAERSMILALKNMVDQSLELSGCTPTDISGALMLFSMYESWYSLGQYKTLFSFSDDSWPAISFEIKLAHDSLLYEKQHEFKSLTKMPSVDHHKVKGQYERFPYPRWQSLDNRNMTNYGRALQHEFPWINIPEKLLTQPLDILVAGCGTGRHALNVAKYFYQANVTAIDISQTSLDYAYKKSAEFGIDNIDFYLADLTRLGKQQNAFDIIECSGVLHHIPQYHCALENLLMNLKPNGFMKLSLYSQRARQSVYDIRDQYKHGGIENNEQDIRILRHVIFSENKIKNKHLITESNDFYSMSGVVDLLLHEFEVGFTPKTIKTLCSHHQLTFLGFSSLDNMLKQAFKDFIGENYNFCDLDQWEDYEKSHPETFSNMYQFYCQYQPQLALKPLKKPHE